MGINQERFSEKRPLLSFILLLFFLAPALWFTHDRVNLLEDAELQQATIIKCDYKYFSSSASTTRTGIRRTSYTPIAITEQGEKVLGTLWWSSRNFCERRLNKQVSVFIHPTNPEKNRINSFFQLWLYPSLAIYFGFVILSFYFGRQKISTILTLLLFALLAINYYREFQPASIADTSQQAETSDRSKAVLDRCIAHQMKESKLANRSEITRVLCQDAGITNLSSIADLSSLQELYLQGNKLTSLETIPDLINLKIISIANNEMRTLSGVEKLVQLEELQANKNKIDDLSGMQALSQLKIIGLMKNQIKSIAPLEPLTNLEDITLNYNLITDISPLANKPHLKKATFYSNDVKDITALFSNANMVIVGVRGRGMVPCNQISGIRKRLAPSAKVWGQKGC